MWLVVRGDCGMSEPCSRGDIVSPRIPFGTGIV